jgi:hypothetical protein
MAAARVLQSQLFGVQGSDPLTYATGALLMLLTAAAVPSSPPAARTDRSDGGAPSRVRSR